MQFIALGLVTPDEIPAHIPVFVFRAVCGRFDRSYIPAAKIEYPWAGVPNPLKLPNFAGRALGPLGTVCITGLCQQNFLDLGSGIGHFCGVIHQMIAAS